MLFVTGAQFPPLSLLIAYRFSSLKGKIYVSILVKQAIAATLINSLTYLLGHDTLETATIESKLTNVVCLIRELRQASA